MKVGDYYYHGLGVPDEPESIRWEKAAGYYQSAADTQMSALAMWNLGWMYGNGVGVKQVRVSHRPGMWSMLTCIEELPPREASVRSHLRDQ